MFNDKYLLPSLNQDEVTSSVFLQISKPSPQLPNWSMDKTGYKLHIPLPFYGTTAGNIGFFGSHKHPLPLILE